MKKLSCLIAVVFCTTVACGCGSDGINDLGYKDMKAGCDDLMGGFTACGGDVEGTWVFEAQCADFDIGIPEFEDLQTVCSGIEMGVASDIEGTVEIDETTITRNITSQTIVMRMFLPKTCMGTAACSEIETALTQAFMEETGIEVSCSGGGDCECYISMSLGGDSGSDDYFIEGNNLVIDDPMGTMSTPYCVTGDEIVIVRTEEDEDGLSGQIYMKLKKQS